MLLFSLHAHSTIGGSWAGELNRIFEGEVYGSLKCRFEIKINNNSLVFRDEEGCTFMWEKLERNGGDLLIDNVQVGTLTDNELKINSSDDFRQFAFSAVTLGNGKIKIQESVTHGSFTATLDGEMTKGISHPIEF